MQRKIAEISIKISRDKIFKSLLLLILAFTLLSITVFALGELFPNEFFASETLAAWFDLDSEQSIPTYYSVYALQSCALLLYIISYFVKVSQDKFLRHWQALALIFVYLSLDEAISIHERAMEPLRDALPNTGGFLYFTWVVPGALLVTIFCFSYLRFLIALPKRIRYLFLAAGGLFVSGAIGMEMIGGKVFTMGLPRVFYVLAFTCEEFLEMLGIVVFLYALLSYLKSRLIKAEISFDK